MLPNTTIADDRTAGTACPACEAVLRAGEPVTICRACGAAHHQTCWDQSGACSAYDCAPASRVSSAGTSPGVGLVITTEEISAAAPLPSRASFQGVRVATQGQIETKARPKLSRGAIAAAICAVGGIPFFGIITGAVAVVVACLSLGPIRAGARRGTWLVIFAILLGLADVVGWAIVITRGLSGSAFIAFDTEDFRVSESDLAAAPPVVAAALRANVLISRQSTLSASIGSGVIVSVLDGKALILTNQHVAAPSGAEAGGSVSVQFVDGSTAQGEVVWVAPDGVDAALVRASASSGAGAAVLDPAMTPHIGDDVFAVGNPQGLGWTHTKGSISQFRERRGDGMRTLRIIQTSAPINPGNSGGGLYDAAGHLIGINTWAGDKRDSEGLGFALSISSISAYLPGWAMDEHAEGKPPR